MMWTNVFRIGGHKTYSWFQFLPSESDLHSFSEKSSKAEHKDAANYLVLSAHLQLQSEGLLSTWTNSFVGPWDPSQGVHNPDEKIKLWLFLPERDSSLNETVQASVSKLRVIGSGLWVAPGDSEEVAVALSQALRNKIERALRGLSYMRYGDVFARCAPSACYENNFRRVQPVVEFIFAATEEAIYVHAIISAKHVRGLSNNDLERVLRYHSSNVTGKGLPVIVAPTGMRGKLTGCQPSEFVKQVYISKAKASSVRPIYASSQSRSSGCQLRGQSCYVEVNLGFTLSSNMKTLQTSCYHMENASQSHVEEPQLTSMGSGHQKQGQVDQLPNLERTFVYPTETVLVPIMRRAFARSSLKRFWLQGWKGDSLFELWPLWNFCGSSHLDHCLSFATISDDGFFDVVGSTRLGRRCNSSSNSITSSISSISSTSSESNYKTTVGGGDLEADADSLTSRRSGLSANDQFEKDEKKTVSKSPRMGGPDISNQAGVTIQESFQSEIVATDGNSSAIVGLTSSQWDWDDDDAGLGINIHTLLSEFGDFGDFFENDTLSFGEPPGTAESHALIFPADCGDVTSNPTGEVFVSDQKLSPVSLASFEGFNNFSAAAPTEAAARTKSNECTEEVRSSVTGSNSSAPSSGKFDSLTKAEALLTFAPEFAAIDMPMPNNEFSTTIFRTPYLPRSKRVENSHPSSSSYAYSAAPPPNHKAILDERLQMPAKADPGGMGHDSSSIFQLRNLYTPVLSSNKRKRPANIDPPSTKGDSSPSTSMTLQRKKDRRTLEAEGILLTSKTVLATEVECIMFQAAMCRIRHTVLSLAVQLPSGWNMLIGSSISDLMLNDGCTTSDMMSNRYETKKKDPVPVRIAGDFEVSVADGPITVGVWRPIEAPKATNLPNARNYENASSLSHNSLSDGVSVSFMQRQPLKDLLDAMPLLVQQCATFVDVSLDTDDGEGSFSLLALQEQQRREFSCGPSMVHAGCGGLLASSHSVDIAGVDLIDPLSSDIQVSSVINLLQSDIKLALRSAFGNLEGPLPVIDWCQGRCSPGDSGTGDAHSSQFVANDSKDSSSTLTLVGEPMSPPQSSGGSSSTRDTARADDASRKRSNQDLSAPDSEHQKGSSRSRPTVTMLSLPSILVGYQEDWLKTATSCLQFWEKAPLEPYASPKAITYYAVCPEIDLLTSAASDFFQQLGAVYEACRLGSHTPQVSGQIELASGKILASGLVLIDCPQEVKVASSNITSRSSINDCFFSLSKSWDVKNFTTCLVKILKDLMISTNSSANQKEGGLGPYTVIYVVCPFPDPLSVLQTLVGSCAALGSAVQFPDRDRRSSLHAEVAKSLSCTVAVDEASTSNVLMLSGFSIPKLVLQIVTVESLLKVSRPVNELALLKDIAFTVYNKARRIARSTSTIDMLQPSLISARSQAGLMHGSSSITGLWKDSLARMPPQAFTREGEVNTWDSSWQASRTGGISYDPNRSANLSCIDDTRYMFEPLFILAEPGNVDSGSYPMQYGNATSEPSKSVVDENSDAYLQSSSGGSKDVGSNFFFDNGDQDQKPTRLHCCYGWTEDWRWLVCIWTDSRGELLDSTIFPFGGISSRQDTKILQSLFVQLLQHACQILLRASPDSSNIKPRDIIITRIGCFFELECQEWQKAIYTFGGSEVKKWPLQLRRSMPDPVSSSNNGTSLQQQDMGLIQERNLPSSPGPLYSPHTKSSSFMKSSLGQSNTKRQLLAGQPGVDGLRGFLQLVQSITLIGVSIDHSLHFILPAEMSSAGGTSTSSGYLEGFSPVKSLGSMPSSYLLIPSPGMRYLPPAPLQLPTCLTSESPPLAHLLHSKGSAIPLSMGYVVSKAVPTMRKDPAEPSKGDWPAILSVSLVDHYGGNNTNVQEKAIRGGSNVNASKQGRSSGLETVNRDYEVEAHSVLESVAAELHSLSWLTVSPLYLERRTALPFHCDMFLRLRRLLFYADKEFSRAHENPAQAS